MISQLQGSISPTKQAILCVSFQSEGSYLLSDSPSFLEIGGIKLILNFLYKLIFNLKLMLSYYKSRPHYNLITSKIVDLVKIDLIKVDVSQI